MFLERKTTDEDVDMGLCYSIYYGKLIFQDGTPNSLRKRLIMYCLEDMAR